MIITVKGADFSQCGLGKVATVVTDETKNIMNKYPGKNTAENQRALQVFFDSLGKGTDGSVWSKIRTLFLPLLASDVNEAWINLGAFTDFKPNDIIASTELKDGGVVRKEGTTLGAIADTISNSAFGSLVSLESGEKVICKTGGGIIASTVSMVVKSKTTSSKDYALTAKYSSSKFAGCWYTGNKTNDKVGIVTDNEVFEADIWEDLAPNALLGATLLLDTKSKANPDAPIAVLGTIAMPSSKEDLIKIRDAVKSLTESIL